MEEDEEVIFENTGLCAHLLNTGFKDFEIIRENKFQHNYLKTDFTKTESFNSERTIHYNVEEINEFIDYINSFLNSNLVFHDDALFVKNFVAYFEVNSPETSYLSSQYFRIILKTAAISSVCVLCYLCGVKMKPLAYFSLHTIPIGMYFAENSFRIYVKYKRKNIIQKLLKNLRDFSMLVQKSIRFVQECEVMSYNDSSLQNKETLLKDNRKELQNVDHLRKLIFSTIQSIILDLRILIKSLIENLPLKETVESLSFYIAYLSENDLHCYYAEDFISVQHLQKMKYVYFLLQSEFLRRLCLCFIPYLWIYDTKVSFRELFKSLNNFSKKSSNKYKSLKSVFEIYYIYEKVDNNKCSSLKTDTKWAYREAYVKFCSLSLNMQSVLRESRRIEEYLENIFIQDTTHENIVKVLDKESENIVKNFNICKVALDDIRKYIVNLKPKEISSNVLNFPTFKTDVGIHKTNILLGVTDFRPDWSDEVFVGTSDVKTEETEIIDSEEVAKSPCSKLLINELKIALQNKAKEWKERERLALKNKNIDLGDVEEILSDTETVDSDENDKEISSLFKQENTDVLTLENMKACEFRPIVTSESLLAKQIASVSASWGLHAEEYFIEDDSE